MKLHHIDLGGTGHPPLLLLHGLLGSSRNWQTTGRDLSAHFHVFALDARNHGKSPHAASSDTAAMTGDVARWMQGRGLAQATILGHSMGGRTAMHLACHRPELVSRLVVVDIAPRTYPDSFVLSHFPVLQALDLKTLGSRQEAEQRLAAAVPDPGMRKFLVTNLAQDASARWHWTVNLASLALAQPEMTRNPLRPDDRYAGPALFIRGGRSPYVRDEDLPAIQTHFPAARIITLEGAGHNPHIDRRAEFVQAVLA